MKATSGVSTGGLRALPPVAIAATDDYPCTVYLPLALNEFCTLPTGLANVTLSLEATDELSHDGPRVMRAHHASVATSAEMGYNQKRWVRQT